MNYCPINKKECNLLEDGCIFVIELEDGTKECGLKYCVELLIDVGERFSDILDRIEERFNKGEV